MSIPTGFRYALRNLWTTRGFVALFVLTLALGLAGVNTIFSVVNTLILRPLPFPHSDRLVTITETVPFMGSGPQICTLDEFERWRKSRLLESAAAINTIELTLNGKDRAELLVGARVTPDFFRVFGISPVLGRGFLPEDATLGREDVIILSNQLWARRFASDPNVICSTTISARWSGERSLFIHGPRGRHLRGALCRNVRQRQRHENRGRTCGDVRRPRRFPPEMS